MKKAYSKPQILFDSFQLSQSIATGCVAIANNESVEKCSYTDENAGDINIFLTENICEFTQDPTSTKICYDVPFDTSVLFTS